MCIRDRAAADELIRGHGLAGRALFSFADRLQRLENRLLLSGGGALTQALQRLGHYADTCLLYTSRCV